MLAKKWLKEVRKIKRKYGVKRNYDLFKKLNELPTAISLYTQMRKNTPRLSEIKDNAEALMNASEALKALLVNVKASTKYFFDEVPDKLCKMGFGDIRLPNQNWLISRFETDLTIFHRICSYANAQIPKDEGGRTKNSIPKYAIFKLVALILP